MYERNFHSWLTYMSDLRHCRDLLCQGSRSFYAASWLLPGYQRAPIVALYAFCRVADDEVDRLGAGRCALEALDERLERIYADRPVDDPVDRAFADVVRIYGIPRQIPAALFEGFAWDLDNRTYDSLSDVYAYGARVAGTVGTMMAIIMGVRQPALLARACDLGVAMQLTNIARDVGEDARAGRLYLPRKLLFERGIDPGAFLAQPVYSEAIGAVTAELLHAADALYARADRGLSQLPAGCRPAMFAARTIYAEIGREIAANGMDSVSVRAVVPARRKLALLGQAVGNALTAQPADDAQVLPEARFLVDAVSGA
jgi:phytoene synthase